ncbi:H-NS family nucleoid-associated regulatory protein [Paraburkholderia phosphatilytica]|uniref:H-NS family nucleoid-associated regulatory protein n=1 Tax=Paraburkholderia phosphatilytica TaxID=2282883 RepID=UPI0030B7F93B
MYQDPKSGATWSGRGRAPAWLANVKDRTKFLIASGVKAVVATNAGAVSKAKVAVKKTSEAVGMTSTKGPPKGPQPAKYRDPKTGASWSGRGPAPAWLAGAKDRSKFLIDAAGAAANMSASTQAKPSAKKGSCQEGAATKRGRAGSGGRSRVRRQVDDLNVVVRCQVEQRLFGSTEFAT